MKNKIIKVINLFLVLICIASVVYITHNVYSLNQEEKYFVNLVEKTEQINDIVLNPAIKEKNEGELQNPKPDEVIVENEAVEEEKTILSKYDDLYRQNSDMIGWIKIEETKINYPVMQTESDNPIYYINKNFEKTESVSGTPFIDSRCTLESENIIIYSHNMKNGTMFGGLTKYRDEEYYENHRIINFDTIYEERKYEIIAVVLTKVFYYEEPQNGTFEFYNYIELDTEEQINKYLAELKKHSLYETDVFATGDDEFITLVTCNYHTEDGRILVVAKRIQ